jgi:hypothetical protein
MPIYALELRIAPKIVLSGQFQTEHDAQRFAEELTTYNDEKTWRDIFTIVQLEEEATC